MLSQGRHERRLLQLPPTHCGVSFCHSLSFNWLRGKNKFKEVLEGEKNGVNVFGVFFVVLHSNLVNCLTSYNKVPHIHRLRKKRSIFLVHNGMAFLYCKYILSNYMVDGFSIPLLLFPVSILKTLLLSSQTKITFFLRPKNSFMCCPIFPKYRRKSKELWTYRGPFCSLRKTEC